MGNHKLPESYSTSSTREDIRNASSNEMQPVITSVFSQGAKSLFHNEGSVNVASKSCLILKIVPKKHKVAKQNKKQISPYSTNFPRVQNQIPLHKNSFVCEICKDVSFTHINTLISHVRKEHYFSSFNEPFFKHYFDMKPFHCTLCNVSIPTKTCLKDHMTKTHGNMPYFVCNVCNKIFSQKSHLQTHMEIVHPGKKVAFREQYECKTCCIFFSNESKYREHQRIGRHGVLCLK